MKEVKIRIVKQPTPEYNGITCIPINEHTHIQISEEDLDKLSTEKEVEATYLMVNEGGYYTDGLTINLEIQSDIKTLQDKYLAIALFNSKSTGTL